MPDEFVTRYQGLTHEQLWNQLKAGDPNQIDTLAAAWKSVHDTADGLATTLHQDLTELATGWSSSSGTEYQNRVGLISSFSSELSADFHGMQSGLTLMSGLLRTAQKEAEDPAAADNNDNLITDAAIGLAIAGPVGGVVGGWLGHNQDEAEKEKARQRMVQLVAGLAADYTVSQANSMSAMAPMPPAGLPGDDPAGIRFSPTSGPTVTTPSRVGPTHDSVATRRTIDDPTEVAPGPDNGSLSPSEDSTADGLIGPTGPITTLAGAGGLIGAGALGGAGLTASAFGAAGAGGGAGAGLGPMETAASGYPLGGAASAPAGPEGSPTGQARSVSVPGDPESAESRRLSQRRSAAGTGHGEDDGPDERLTWLTEDDIVWGAEEVAPSVLGGRPAEDPDAEDEEAG